MIRKIAAIVGALLLASAPAFAQTYPATATDSNSRINVVTPTACIANCSSGTPATSATVSFQQTCTASAAALPSNTLKNGVVVKALTTNTGTAYVGPAGVTTANGYPLVAGEPAPGVSVANSNQIYLICDATAAAASDKVAGFGN